VEHSGNYDILLDLSASERAPDETPDYNKCQLVFKVDGAELFKREYARDGSKAYHYDFKRDWKAGPHELTFELQPLTQEKQVRSLSLRIESATIRGPFDEKYFVRPKGYERFFTKDAPRGKAERHAYARELLERFATKAFRRPIDDGTLERLTSLAETHYSQPDKTFESGVAHAMEAVLASPQFLFRQERVGMKGKSFQIMKFRSMYQNAEANGPVWAATADSRITKVGRLLRKYRLDEFPQLFNVLRGEMSLVGPRPLILEEAAHVDAWARQRLALKPGMTGLWQVSGRNSIPFEEMVRLDYLYVTTWSLVNDVKLMMDTIPLVFRGQRNGHW